MLRQRELNCGSVLELRRIPVAEKLKIPYTGEFDLAFFLRNNALH